MPNIKFLDNVVHHGILLKKGMIVDGSEQGLGAVVQNLIDRKLVEPTDEAATHTATLVDGGQQAMPRSSSVGGQAPNAADDAARKAAAQAAQVPATPQMQNQVIDQANVEAQPRVVHQPTPEEVARTAAQVN